MNNFITKEEIDKYKELDAKIRSHARKVLVKWYDILKKNNYIRFIEPICEDEIIFYEHYFSTPASSDEYRVYNVGQSLTYDCLSVEKEYELDLFLENKFKQKIKEEEDARLKREKEEQETRDLFKKQAEKERYQLYLRLKEEYGSK